MSRKKRDEIYCDSFSHRFREALEILGESPVTVYEKLGYSTPSTLYSIASGRCLPDIARLAGLSELKSPGGYRINIDWLLTGRGEKLLITSGARKKRHEIEDILERCTRKQLTALVTILDRGEGSYSK